MKIRLFKGGRIIKIDDKNMKNKTMIIERNVIIDGISVHVKSIFSHCITLDKALGNIAMRKLSEGKYKKS